MRGGMLVLSVAALGCASAARAPVITVPERCVCPTATKDCEREVASNTHSTTTAMSPEELNAFYRARSLATVGEKADQELDDEGLLDEGQSQLNALDPSVVEASATLGAEGPEHDILRAMHELRALPAGDDATPTAEKKLIVWQRFEAEVETFRVNSRLAIASRLADVLLDRNAIASIVAKVAKWVNPEYAPTADQRLAFATKRARMKLVELATPVAGKLAEALVDTRKGRWLAVLHGKS